MYWERSILKFCTLALFFGPKREVYRIFFLSLFFFFFSINIWRDENEWSKHPTIVNHRFFHFDFHTKTSHKRRITVVSSNDNTLFFLRLNFHSSCLTNHRSSTTASADYKKSRDQMEQN